MYQKNRESLFDIKTRRKPFLLLSCATRRSYSIDDIHGRNQWHAFVPVSHCLVVIFPENTPWRSIANVGGVLCCCCGASASVDVLVACRGQLEKERSCWYVNDKKKCVASYLTCSLLLIADSSSLVSYKEPVAPVVHLVVTFEYC